MLFNSYVFWVFFAVVLLAYRRLPHRGQNRMLLVASYLFYGWWDWRFLSLIFISTVIDYIAAVNIVKTDSPRRRKLLLALSACTNLGLLGTFKYYGFFSTELVSLFSALSLPVSLPSMKIILPVGISFYTFQTMSYTIDVYRGKTEPVRNFLDFALYVCFFPQLVAGPIERSGRLMPQILEPRKNRPDDFRVGLYLVLMGLFKKIVVADNMAAVVDTVFRAEASQLSGVEVLVAAYAFTFQIYCDFSGYSSIARGVARWLGFDLMVNFRVPYLARTPSEFWQRWHISLSTWLRDYLYIPLGGNRGSKLKTYRNLMLTMLLGGLWHGANWTFIAWGGFHGAALCAYRLIGERRLDTSPKAPRWPIWKTVLAVLVMFHIVCVGLLIFRSESMAQAWQLAGRVFGAFHVTDYGLYAIGMFLFYVGPITLYEYWLHRTDDLLRLTKVHWAIRGAWYCYLVLMMWFFIPLEQHAFIYFQF